MIAPLATLVVLATLWLLVVVAASILEESGAKIAAALGGRGSPPRLALQPVRLRTRQRLQRPIRARAGHRAAA